MYRLAVALTVPALLVAAPGKDCVPCHPKEVASFQASAMGRSAGRAEERHGGEVNDAVARTMIRIRSRDGVMYQILERGKVKAQYPLAWQVGAGVVGYTYLISVHSYLLQSPASFYVKKNGWDLTPGYEPEKEMDADHPVVSGCLFCHTSAVRLQEGSQNRYQADALDAISCGRCHGPAETHLKNPVAGTIVNPAKLPERERDSVCEQCHLEGLTRVLNPGKDWWNFHAGEKLEDTFVTYVEGSSLEKGVPAVSQAEELAVSRCARESGGRLWCGTCHDSHGEVGSAAKRVTQACLSCHKELLATGKHPPAKECVSCHMPRIRSANVAHASITDHRIVRKEYAPKDTKAVKGRIDVRAWREAPAGLTERDEGLALFEAATVEAPGRRGELLGRAYELLRQAARRDGRDARVLATLGSILFETRYTAQAVFLFEQASKLDSRNPQLVYDYATSLLKMGDREGAIRALRRSIGIDASFASGYEKLAEIYASEGMEGQRRQVIEEYLAVMPQSIRFRILLNGSPDE